MMSDQSDNLTNILMRYGLTSQEADIYIHLSQNPSLTALQISRALHLSRTKVYRLLDKLAITGLVRQQIDSRGLKFSAASPEALFPLVSSKEAEVSSLRQNLPQLVSQVSALQASVSSSSRVMVYHGVSGLTQVNYNLTHADGLIRVYEVEHLSDFIPQETAEDIRRKLVQSQITTHDLTNKTSFPDFTQVTEMIENFSQFRHIDPKMLKISFEALIYNNVYATYSYTGNEIFCIEIHNPELAAMQKQIFDFIWEQAKPLKFTSPHGAARLT